VAETTPAVPRLKTGVPGFDELLDGGLLRGRALLLKGSPGSGKTTLGLQMLVEGATQFDEPGILVTFEQMPLQLYADATGFGWDLKGLDEEGSVKVVFVTPEEVLEHRGREANRLLVNIADWVDDFGSKRILIDSISHLGALFNKEEARAGFMKFIVQLKALGLTPIMTSELDAASGLQGMDAYLVDSVAHLDYKGGGSGGRDHRTIELVKTRGTRHISGRHPVQICSEGVVIFPHSYALAGPAEPGEATEEVAHLSSGVPGMDVLLNGGFSKGSTVLVAGLSGTFKSTMAGHFLLGGPDDNPPSLWISFHESQSELVRGFSARGIPLAAACDAGRLKVMEVVAGLEPIEKIFTRARNLIEEHEIERVVVDSLNDLTLSFAPAEDKMEGVRWFLRRLKGTGVTVLLTEQLSRVTGRNPLSEIAWAELADTIIYLGLVEIESRLEKVISVLKHRGGDTQGDLRGISFFENGLRLSERFFGLSGLLDGTALGQRKSQIEEIFQPLYFVRDFLQLAKDPKLAEDKRTAMLEQLGSETLRVIELLSKYFDQPLSERTGSSSGAKKPS